MVALPYRRGQEIAPGVVLKFLDAGHVLGSAVVAGHRGDDTRIAFAVDLGRKGMPILREPEVPSGINCLMMESTYGDRLHAPIEEVGDALAAAINRTAKRGGKIIIPCFALERAQEVVYALKRLRRANQVPALPVYVDSPLTVKLTDVFKMHPECYDKETYALLVGGDSPLLVRRRLHYVSDKEESKPSPPARDPTSSSRPAACAKPAASCITCAKASRIRATPSSSSAIRRRARSGPPHRWSASAR